jgi:hypothetical protein
MQLLNESGEAEDLFTIYRNQNIHLSLKEFLEKKPNLAESILHKLEKVTNKLIEKGLMRHTIVQAILYDFYQ